MNELTLQWQEGDQLKTQAIGDQHPSRQPGVVRLGRDPARCDIVFQERSVSGLHVEIGWQQHQFYIRNLRPSNPPYLDHAPLAEGQRPLHTGSRIHLGRLELAVVSIQLAAIPPVPPPPPPSTHSPAQPASYGIKCPGCSNVLPYTPESLQQGCPHCGSSLAAGVTVGPFPT